MGEIRIVGPGNTRGYPYPVCKKEFSSIAKNRTNSVSKVRKYFLSTILSHGKSFSRNRL